MEEDVLWYRPADDDVHSAQLRHLLAAMRRPTVSLGVIPRRLRRRGVCPEESFTMSDASVVTVELVSGTLTLSQPYEIRLYMEAWERLFGLAVHGDRARALILGALDALDEEADAG